MSNQILIQDGPDRLDATMFEDNNGVLAYSLEDGQIQELRYLRRYTEGGKTIYVKREEGLAQGAYVRCKHTAEEAMEIIANNPGWEAFRGEKLFRGLENRVFKYRQDSLHPIVGQDGSVIEVETVSLSCIDPDINGGPILPKEWMELIPEEDRINIQAREEIGEVLAAMESKKSTSISELYNMHQNKMHELKALDEQIRAVNTKKPEDYVLQELNSKAQLYAAVNDDVRVLSIKEDGDNFVIITDFLWTTIQSYLDEPLKFPIGPLKIVLNHHSDAPVYQYLLDNQLNGHPHDLGSGRICRGAYSGGYSRAMADRDFYTGFNIAIEILENANLEDTAMSMERVLTNHALPHPGVYAGDEEKVRENNEYFEEFYEKKIKKQYEEWVKKVPRSISKPKKKYDDKLVIDIVKELTNQ